MMPLNDAGSVGTHSCDNENGVMVLSRAHFGIITCMNRAFRDRERER